jgi:hypothetical protein
MLQEGHIFSLKPTHWTFWTDFESKYSDTFAEIDNILQKVAKYYSLEWNPTAATINIDEWKFLFKFHLILLI